MQPLGGRWLAIGGLLVASTLVACSDSEPVHEDDAHVETDANVDDVDAGSPPPCSGDVPDGFFGDRTAEDGTRHWLRETETATTYAIVPAGAPTRTALPRLYEIVRFCADQTVVVLEDDAGNFSRVDYLLGSPLRVCASATTFASEDTALRAQAADATTADTTGCAGHPFTALDSDL